MNLALFDFDGTVTFEDTFTPFIYFASSRSRIAFGTVLLGPMILGYKLGLIAAPRMRAAAARVSFLGRRESELNALGVRYSATLSEVVRPEALEKIRWHQANGDRVVVVSASLEVYLRNWCAQHGVELIGTALESRNGVLSGQYASGDCTGREKARRVRERYDLEQYATIYAYGDTKEDYELLSLATKPFFRWKAWSGAWDHRHAS
ncbi:MAG TPA: HAD-IB family hydrolase [Polyangiaceae bacterium]|nr:HAD-IB family hydrolase [Polyangiaceae bacterium]